MDKFAIDLDKVLDDFELSEDQATFISPGQSQDFAPALQSPKSDCSEHNLILAHKCVSETPGLVNDALSANQQTPFVSSMRYDIYEEPEFVNGVTDLKQSYKELPSNTLSEVSLLANEVRPPTSQNSTSVNISEEHKSLDDIPNNNGDLCKDIHPDSNSKALSTPDLLDFGVSNIALDGSTSSCHSNLPSNYVDGALKTLSNDQTVDKLLLEKSGVDLLANKPVLPLVQNEQLDSQSLHGKAKVDDLKVSVGENNLTKGFSEVSNAELHTPKCDSGYNTIEDGSRQFHSKVSEGEALSQSSISNQAAVSEADAYRIKESISSFSENKKHDLDGGKSENKDVVGFDSVDDIDICDSELEALLSNIKPEFQNFSPRLMNSNDSGIGSVSSDLVAMTKDKPAVSTTDDVYANVSNSDMEEGNSDFDRLAPAPPPSPTHHAHVVEDSKSTDNKFVNGICGRIVHHGARPKQKWFQQDGGTILDKLINEPLPGDLTKREKLAAEGDKTVVCLPLPENTCSALAGFSLAPCNTALLANDVSEHYPVEAQITLQQPDSKTIARPVASRKAQWSDVTMDDNKLQVVIEEHYPMESDTDTLQPTVFSPVDEVSSNEMNETPSVVCPAHSQSHISAHHGRHVPVVVDPRRSESSDDRLITVPGLLQDNDPTDAKNTQNSAVDKTIKDNTGVTEGEQYSAGSVTQQRPTSLNIPTRGKFVPIAADTAQPEELDLNVEELSDQSSTSEGARVTDGVSNTSDDFLAPFTEGLSTISPEEKRLGKLRPYWVPDSEAPSCMKCQLKFTLTKRRHHCRACGRVLCGNCCNMKAKLAYLSNKEARVCQDCYTTMNRVQALEHMNTPTQNTPNPNNPSEYCSTIPPLQQAQENLNQPPPTVMVPVGVLKTEGSKKVSIPGERKQVMFSDGIRPGGDLTEIDGSQDHRPLRRVAGQKRVISPLTPPGDNSPRGGLSSKQQIVKMVTDGGSRLQCLVPEVGLPPVFLLDGSNTDILLEHNPDSDTVIASVKDESAEPVQFLINKNLKVLVKMVSLDCCVNMVCWCFTSRGMCTVGQDEIVVILEALPNEEIPRDIFMYFSNIYLDASKGKRVHHMGHTILDTPFLESRDHCGFLYIRSTFQCLHKLVLPEPPYIFAVLLQKWEIPWVKVFPIRLMLRLGAEFRYYPCPLISVRFRKPVYGEVGHTIMNILADLRNYCYMLPQVKGITIHMEDRKTYINFPRNRYNEIIKVVNNSNDHVMALSSCFSKEADSHLVCIQNDDGNYQTQAINIQNKPRKVTGASFVVFNGALKPASGLTAKSSIVEDGLMVQIVPEDMAMLKSLLKEMKGYTIGCGAIGASQPDEVVEVCWVDDDKDVNIGVKSPIDHQLMDGITSLRIHNSTDYMGASRIIRWTEVFLSNVPDGNTRRTDPVDLNRLAETLARACCIALSEQLDKLKDGGITTVGLRVAIDSESVGYDVGANGKKLPPEYMNELDTHLIPVIHQAASQNQDGPITLELIFHILD